MCLILPIDKIWLVCHVQFSATFVQDNHLWGAQEGVKDLQRAHVALARVHYLGKYIDSTQ